MATGRDNRYFREELLLRSSSYSMTGKAISIPWQALYGVAFKADFPFRMPAANPQ